MICIPLAHAVWMASVGTMSTFIALTMMERAGYRIPPHALLVAEGFLGFVAIVVDRYHPYTLVPVVGIMGHMFWLALQDQVRLVAEVEEQEDRARRVEQWARWAEQQALRKFNPNEAA